MPASLIEPELHDVEMYYWRAFWLLHTERQVGMDLWYIPYSKTIEFYNNNKSYGDVDSFVDIIRAMDGVYMEHSKKPGESKPK